MGAEGIWRRWRPQIVAAATILTLLVLLGGAFYTYLSYREAAAQAIVQRDSELSLLTAVRLQDELAKLAGQLEPLTRSQTVYLGLTAKQRLDLTAQKQRLSVFDGGVVLMDNTGRVRATVPERWDIMGQDWSNQPFFRKMLVAEPPAQYYSSVLPLGPDNSQVVVVAVPVIGQNDEMIGVAAGMFRLGESRVSAFYASVVRLRLTGTGNTYIVDDEGHIIYDSGYQRAGQTVDIAALRAAQKAAPPTRDAEGNDVVASFKEVPGTSWTLVTETDWAQAMAPVQKFATGIILLLALGMVVPTVGVSILARGQRAQMAGADQSAVEARMGKALRERLLPHFTPMLGGWEVAVYHHSATNGATARDLYDYMLLPDGRLMVALATIADNGLSTVHLMTTARAAFRTAACSTPSAGRALSVCNNLLCPDVGPNAAITSLFALLDPVSGRMQVANAGFCAPFRLSYGPESTRDLVEMREGADFLGQALDVEFDHDEVMVGPGDSIIIYSPGALGIRPETGDPFGPERVRRVVNTAAAANAQAIVDALRMDLSEFADAGSLRRVDVTFLALSRPPAPGRVDMPKRSLRDELQALGETDTDL